MAEAVLRLYVNLSKGWRSMEPNTLTSDLKKLYFTNYVNDNAPFLANMIAVLAGVVSLMVLAGLVFSKNFSSSAVIIFVIVLCACAIVIFTAVKEQKKLGRYRIYLHYILSEGICNVDSIAEKSGFEKERVVSELRSLINKNYLYGHLEADAVVCYPGKLNELAALWAESGKRIQ